MSSELYENFRSEASLNDSLAISLGGVASLQVYSTPYQEERFLAYKTCGLGAWKVVVCCLQGKKIYDRNYHKILLDIENSFIIMLFKNKAYKSGIVISLK